MCQTRDAVMQLAKRIQRAGLFLEIEPAHWPPDVVPSSLAEDLTETIGKTAGWRHICETEPVVRFPAAVVVPCDLSPVLRESLHFLQTAAEIRALDASQLPELLKGRSLWWTIVTEKLRTAGSDAVFYDFSLSLLPAAFPSRPYFLRDIYVLHSPDSGIAEVLVRDGCRDLTVLEAVQVLLQTAEHFPTEWGYCSTGSITTRNAGMPVEGDAGPVRMHVCVDHEWVSVRDMREDNRRYPQHMYGHHVALCRETIDPFGVADTPLGTLRRVRS